MWLERMAPELCRWRRWTEDGVRMHAHSGALQKPPSLQLPVHVQQRHIRRQSPRRLFRWNWRTDRRWRLWCCDHVRFPFCSSYRRSNSAVSALVNIYHTSSFTGLIFVIICVNISVYVLSKCIASRHPHVCQIFMKHVYIRLIRRRYSKYLIE